MHMLMSNIKIRGILLSDIDRFIDAIQSGFGWIDSDDVERQWKGFFQFALNDDQLEFLIQTLQENDLIREYEDLSEVDHEDEEEYDNCRCPDHVKIN